jgi:CHRD domain
MYNRRLAEGYHRCPGGSSSVGDWDREELDPQPSDVPEGTPACPTRAGTVTGTLMASNIINRASAQGITNGELAEVLDAMRRGATYANVHSKTFPAGEIRGQIVKIPGTD